MAQMDQPPSRDRPANLFGSRTRDRLLILLALREDVHLRGAARALGAGPSEITKAVASLERIGVVASTLVGSTRFIELNRRWYAAAELRSLLKRMGEADRTLSEAAATARTRPRRIGKPV